MPITPNWNAAPSKDVLLKDIGRKSLLLKHRRWGANPVGCVISEIIYPISHNTEPRASMTKDMVDI